MASASELLDRIREDLRDQEETILGAFFQRARYRRNACLYAAESPHRKRLTEAATLRDEPVSYPLEPNTVGLTRPLVESFTEKILPLLCQPGDDGRHAQTLAADEACLRALSRRLHYGKYVAEAKFLADREGYRPLMRNGDDEALMARLRDPEQERRILERIGGRAEWIASPAPERLPSATAVRLFEEEIMPLNCALQVLYLRERRLS